MERDGEGSASPRERSLGWTILSDRARRAGICSQVCLDVPISPFLTPRMLLLTEDAVARSWSGPPLSPRGKTL